MKYKNLEKLVEVIKTLRSENGCKWDKEQTHQTLTKNLLEETYELLDAINENSSNDMKEELGDVLLQVILHAQIAKDNNNFDIEDIAKGISDKLIRRHPHVFGNTNVSSTDEIIKNWEDIKKEEKSHRKSVIDGVAKSQPALLSAYKISKKAVSVGFEWPDEKTLWECVNSEMEEFKQAKDKEHKQEELGDILFAVVNLARWHKIEPEQALLKANEKFKKRFMKMEELAKKDMSEHSFEEYDKLWKEAKAKLKK